MIKYLEKDNFDEEVKSGRILVDFYADCVDHVKWWELF